MAYRSTDARKTLFDYMNLNEEDIEYIDKTDNRGFVLHHKGQSCVIFVYPISHKDDDSKNFFDTRDSGAWERGNAWNYALEHNLKYFCFGVHSIVPRYKNYIFSLECDEKTIERVSGTKNGSRAGSGTQVVIPNDFEPVNSFQRIQTRNGFYISAIIKESIYTYIEMFDNRPYLLNNEIIDLDLSTFSGDSDESSASIKYVTNFESAYPRNRIIFGAPGTGKSFMLDEQREDFLGADNESDYERVTFHPDYSYANFVGTYKPVPRKDESDKDIITYEYVPGPFMRVYVNALRDAKSNNPRPHLLIIEEINRANVAAVFGDIFQLLDRDENNASKYPIQASEDMKKYLAKELGGEPKDYLKIRIPDNMFIWATMNSADQGVFFMDTAFKRRWDFTYIGIDDNDKEIEGKTVILGKNPQIKVEWNKLRKEINNFLASNKINEDKQLGPYFIDRRIAVPEIGNEIDSLKFSETFKSKVIMYLFEDAAKQKRSTLFDGCGEGKERYSDICRQFDQKGIKIFNEAIWSKIDYEEVNSESEANSKEV